MRKKVKEILDSCIEELYDYQVMLSQGDISVSAFQSLCITVYGRIKMSVDIGYLDHADANSYIDIVQSLVVN